MKFKINKVSSGRTSKNVEAKETKSSGKRKSSLTNHEIPKAHNSVINFFFLTLYFFLKFKPHS